MLNKKGFYRVWCSSCMTCKNGSAIGFCYRIYSLSPQAFSNRINKKMITNRSSIISIVFGDYSVKNLRKRDIFRRVFCDNLPCSGCYADDVDVDLCAHEFNGGTITQTQSIVRNYEDKSEEVCLILSDNEDFRKEFYSIIENSNKQRGEDN